jgi:hypothetical protein
MPVAFSPSIKSYFHQSDYRTTLVGARADPGRLSSAGIALLDPWQPGPPCRLQVAVRALQVSYLLIKHHGTMRAVCAPTAYLLSIEVTHSERSRFRHRVIPHNAVGFCMQPSKRTGCRSGMQRRQVATHGQCTPPARLRATAGRCFGFCARAMPHAVLHSGEWPSFPPAPPSRVSPAFSLLPEMRQHKYELSAPLRVQLQLRRWRRDPIFGIIENKLLQATLLSSIANARQARVVYGAFATKAMGTWPIWSRTSLERALEGMRHFVLKSATNGGGADVLIMTEERWHREGWRVENVSRYAGRWMERGAPRSPYPKALHTSRLTHASRVCGVARLAEWRQQQVYSEWGQQYEHRGVIVQENLSPIRNQPSDVSLQPSKLAIPPPPGKLSFELKANVAFGQLGLAGLFVLPKAESVHLDISFCGPGRISCTGRRCVGGRGVCAAYCKRARRYAADDRAKVE